MTKIDVPLLSTDTRGDGNFNYTKILMAFIIEMFMQVVHLQRSGSYLTIKVYSNCLCSP